MKLGMVGLGRMGANMARRLLRAGHECVAFDLNRDNVAAIAADGGGSAATLADLVKSLPQPRAVWVMVPAGAPTEQSVEQLGALMSAGDIIIDGGNSFYKDDVRRAAKLAERGIHYLDVGTSGGVWGLERGYCLMIGGNAEAVRHVEPLFRALAPGRGSIPPADGRESTSSSAEEGYLHCGPAGAGHFVKMVHNGIEYGLMQAYAEGFDIMKAAGTDQRPEAMRYNLNLADISELWRRGSVVSSWLLDLTAAALAQSPELSEFTGSVDDSGEGRWTVEAAIEQAVPADVLSAALYARFRSRVSHTFGEKLLSAMRHQFGGHVEKAAKPVK